MTVYRILNNAGINNRVRKQVYCYLMMHLLNSAASCPLASVGHLAVPPGGRAAPPRGRHQTHPRVPGHRGHQGE